MPKTHPTYDAPFRQGAVDLLLSSGRPLKRVAADLGVSANALRTWRDLALGKGRGAAAPAAQPPGQSDVPFADPAAEIRRLPRENEYLRRQQRDPISEPVNRFFALGVDKVVPGESAPARRAR